LSVPDRDYDLYARYYPWRVPYAPRFFPAVASSIGLTRNSVVLDLACGTGELAVGLAPYCRIAVGVDRSTQMLSTRGQRPRNVRFVQADLHAGKLRLSQPADLVTIGRALHYLKRDALLPLLLSVTNPLSAILICNSQIQRKTAWWGGYWSLLGSYVEPLSFPDYYGKAFFTGTGWSPVHQTKAIGVMRYTIEDMRVHTLSYPHYAEALKEHEHEFRERLEAVLTPYCGADGRLETRIFSDAWAYRRS
jgi:SAM-dependent methyltransferase